MAGRRKRSEALDNVLDAIPNQHTGGVVGREGREIALRVLKRLKQWSAAKLQLPASDPTECAVRLTGLNRSTLFRFKVALEKEGELKDPEPGNYFAHEESLSPDVYSEIRVFMTDRAHRQVTTTATDICDFLGARDPPINVSIRTCERAAKRMHLRFGVVPRHHGPILTPAVLALRRAFLDKIDGFRNLGRVIVYLDESYVHHHHKRKWGWYGGFLPDMPAGAHKGKRWIILGAGWERGWIEGSVVVYDPIAGTDGFKGNINSDLFIKYLKEHVIPKLPPNSVVVMDNARYHKMFADEDAKLPMKKDELQLVLRERGVAFDETCLKAELVSLFKKHVAPTLVPKAVQLLRQHGHDALFMPPGHPDLNAIELAWAQAKQSVRKQYEKGKTFEAVGKTLREELFKVNAKSWAKLVASTKRKEAEFRERDREMYDSENPEPLVDDSGSESDSICEFSEEEGVE